MNFICDKIFLDIQYFRSSVKGVAGAKKQGNNITIFALWMMLLEGKREEENLPSQTRVNEGHTKAMIVVTKKREVVLEMCVRIIHTN